MLELRPMNAAAFERFVAHSAPQYAAEKVASGEWTPEEAPERGEREFRQLLPQGPDTPDNVLYHLHDPQEGADVGVLWYALQQRAGTVCAFVYEIEVYEPYRRRGYATQAFTLLEHDAAAHGATNIQLHVFGHNTGARALYEGLGFQTTNVIMRKELG
ncbi:MULTISPECIES: GNAT family N-acetyltransferase [Deinococcus]|uniref:GNAT family N-acetyltransferase n=1 Tax=Deinococcus rufus TaxID=2136097 RepID=A0ABV7Z7I3_9DEIO|nr:GNAT family N-acetyltransferase [Deinococcus sp. AB2017081]WQE95394.1 GNAT family N-acetyltransferase [Deinococcus sp. AB2017081]